MPPGPVSVELDIYNVKYPVKCVEEDGSYTRSLPINVST